MERDKTMLKETFLEGYIACALWIETDHLDESGGHPLENNYDDDDLAPETLAKMKKDCEEFQKQAGNLLKDIEDGLAGHDFWLTRNGHGSGYWDSDLGEIGDKLTELCEKFPGVNLYVGDNNLIYFL